MYGDIPFGNKQYFVLRCLTVSINSNLGQSVVKYLSLTFIAICTQITPIVTIILSSLFLYTTVLYSDLIFPFISFSAVILVVLGYKDTKDHLYHSTNLEFLVAVIAALFIPILGAFNSIINRKLKDLPDRTITCYTNPS